MFEERNEEQKGFGKNNGMLVMVVSAFAIIAAVVGVSLAIWTWTFTGDNNTLSTGSIELTMLESEDAINMGNFLPMSDANGKALNSAGSKFDFMVSSTTTGAAGTMTYSVTATKVAVDTGYNALPDANVKFYVTSLTSTDESQVLAPTLASTIFASGNTGTLLSNKTHSHTKAGTVSTKYRFRMWVDFNTDASSWNANSKLQYKVKLSVNGSLA